jgi:hypothetical protein
MRIFLASFFILVSFLAFGQTRSRSGWIDFGSSHVNKWLQIAPGKMGPNALPVPEMDYAKIDTMSSFELGVHGHFMKGDRAVNSYAAFNWCVVPKRVAVKIWGFPTETFQMDNSVRDERQIYYDDTGWMTDNGDLWISTFIQLVKENEKWPDLVLNYSAKTTTGSSKNARYTDAPANYYYLAAAKSFYSGKGFINEVRFGLMAGFYVWQTNKVEMAQDEGPLFEVGLKLKHNNWLWANEIGGYRGYDVYEFIGVSGNNDPLVYRSNLTWSGNRFDWKWEFQKGFHDYYYNTFRMSVAYRFRIKK